MAASKFIFDEKILPAIYELIENAQKEITIVSPYINLWGHLLNKLDKAQADDILFIARKNQESKLDDVIKKLNELRMEMRVVENLHAKIYLNEKKCIISSMNLYEFSTSNSKEIAVVIEDKETLRDVNNYIQEELIDVSEVVTQRTSDIIVKGLKGLVGLVSSQGKNDTQKSVPTKKYPAKSHKGQEGYCIRCHEQIKNNLEKPLCPTCFKKWKVYGNTAYKEKYCHVCGKQKQTSIEKPVCSPCFKK